LESELTQEIASLRQALNYKKAPIESEPINDVKDSECVSFWKNFIIPFTLQIKDEENDRFF
jgi:hypothetical protein